MKSLSAFIIKFNDLTEKLDNQLDREMFIALNANFTDEEQDDTMVFDEDNRTMVLFVDPSDKHKVDSVVGAARLIGPEVVGLYEDVTEKFLYQNDFSDYDVQSELITNYIKANLTFDDVLDKVKSLGQENLTQIDKEIFSESAA